MVLRPPRSTRTTTLVPYPTLFRSRVWLRWTGPDEAEITQILAGLERLDRASPIGPWTFDTLRIIDANPEVRAPDLAAELGRPTPELKRDVRKLKERGLTESLAIGDRTRTRLNSSH